MGRTLQSPSSPKEAGSSPPASLAEELARGQFKLNSVTARPVSPIEPTNNDKPPAITTQQPQKTKRSSEKPKPLSMIEEMKLAQNRKAANASSPANVTTVPKSPNSARDLTVSTTSPDSARAFAAEYGECDVPGGCGENCHEYEPEHKNEQGTWFCYCGHRRGQHRKLGNAPESPTKATSTSPRQRGGAPVPETTRQEVMYCNTCQDACPESSSFKCPHCQHYSREHVQGEEAKAALREIEEKKKKAGKERAALDAKRNRPIAWCTECKAVCEEGTSFKCQDCGHYKRDHLSGDEAKQAAMAAGALSPMLSPKEHKQTLNTTTTPSKHDEDLPPLDPNDPVSVV
eukprot:g66425.t1